VVGPDDVVLEIGTGLGTFALFAAAAGARHVWAVDGEPILHVAEALGKVNGHQDRITWLRGWVPELEVPEAVDVLIFEDFVTPLFDVRIYRLLKAAIAKYLAPGGRMIPSRATVFLAPLVAQAVRTRLFPLETVDDRFGIDWSPAEPYLGNLPRQERLPVGSLAGEGMRAYGVEFPHLPQVQEMGGTVQWTLEPGTCLGALCLWFDLDMGGGRVVSNRPGNEAGPWGQLVLPLDPPLAVGVDGIVRATVGYDPAPDGNPGWLRWEAASGTESRGGHEFASSPATLQDFAHPAETSDAVATAHPEAPHV
ncbi:MAG: class I SAM-dependent methyltransferase, partial [Gemmatimonadetes bacterium]|nr:class I SAM-dependent methyltransferase [Gemmatimonadota bacterium]